MLSQECVRELRSCWLPNVSDTGLDRLIDMLEKGSPLLVHGCFTRAVPMGCLATHIAWNHPQTAHLHLDAGISWLYRVANLNPATSLVIREWDNRGSQNWDVRSDLLAEFLHERERRKNAGQIESPVDAFAGADDKKAPPGFEPGMADLQSAAVISQV